MQRTAIFLSIALVVVGAPPAQTPTDASAAQVARALAIHARVMTLDTHKDIPDNLAPSSLPEDPVERERVRRQFDPSYRGDAQVDFPKMRDGGYDVGFFIVFVSQGNNDPVGYRMAYQAANRKFAAIERMAKAFPDDIEVARSPADVERIHAAGKLVACIGIENGHPMGTDLGRIAEFHRRGARYMSIAHNRHSQLGDSHTPAEPLHGGLSDLGRQAVAEMNRVGIMVDISHASKAAALQAMEVSTAPVIASHSGCRAVCDHSRNLDDETLRALKRNGGVVQCVALGSFVKQSSQRNQALAAAREAAGLPPRGRGNRTEIENFEEKLARYREAQRAIDQQYPPADVGDFVDHIDHAVGLIGIDHVAISSDFDGGGGIVGWSDASETANVTIELVRRGYDEEQIQKLWAGNTLRVWRAVERVAAELQR